MNEILQEILPPITAAIGTALAAMAVQFLRVMLKRYNIDLEERQAAKVEHVVKRGVAYAEEQARKHLKAQALSSDGKMSAATEYITAQLPKVKPGQAAQMVEAILPEMRQQADPKA